MLFPRVSVRALLALVVSAGFFLSLFNPFLQTVRSQTAVTRSERKGTPRPGKPEGTFTSLSEIKSGGPLVRQPRPFQPSSIRSPKVPLNPWDQRRVSDPMSGDTQETIRRGAAAKLSQAPEKSGRFILQSPITQRRVARAHAKPRVSPFVISEDDFINNFYSYVMDSYSPLVDEKPYWRDQFRKGYAKNQTAFNLAAIELGKTLFESAYYHSRNTSSSVYVGDLFRGYLMRAATPSEVTTWTAQISALGRENVRRAFEESAAFLNLMATIVPGGAASSASTSLISAQTDPKHQPGGGLLTRDTSWSLPLISLPGRSGLDLGLSLSYSSQVWTRSGPFIYFDEDAGTPSPGFRLGFPTIQRRVYNAQTDTLSYLLITSSGKRVELRQVGTSNVYEAADSSYLQLTDNGSSLLLRATDGTQLTYQEANNAWRCNQVKDRNGNYLTIGVGTLGQITTITDTLGRVLTLNYDSNVNLLNITQTWGGSTTHEWASFGWTTRPLNFSFSNSDVRVIGPAYGTSLPVLEQVTANDGRFYKFDYNNSLQVTTIKKYHWSGNPSTLRATNTFTYQSPGVDVPRLTDSRVSALNWTSVNNVPAEVVTTYEDIGLNQAGNNVYVMTAPDGTTVYQEEYYGSGYKRGLLKTSEVWSSGVKQKWTDFDWTQDNTNLSYQLNPRVKETNVRDAFNNRRRTEIEYTSQFGLPAVITEYQADASTPLRFTSYQYEDSATYVNRRIIGLRKLVQVSDGSWNLMSKVAYNYDLDLSGDLFQDTQAAATQHDRTNYGPSFISGRGNLSQVIRYDVTDSNNGGNTAIERKYRVNIAGSVLLERDHLGHQKQIAYGDDFSDSVNRNTFAYPTVMTDEDNNQSFVEYNFDFGATTWTKGRTPAGQTQGLIQTMLYDADGLLERVTTTNNGAYQRFWYGPDYVASLSTVNTVADEAYAIQYFDGVGRTILSGSNHPNSTGGYKAQQTIYDELGRAAKVSNPAEINGNWVPAGDDAAGWLYTQQTYNWQGKPLITTNPDSTTREFEYSGCGCAGENWITITDEGTVVGGQTKKRQTRIYSDIVGHTVKTEVMNWGGSGPYGIVGNSVHSATVNTYNVRDQIEKIREYGGPGGGSTPYQDTDMTYDGHGRLKTRHYPQQQDDPGNANDSDHTTWTYNADDTIATIKDARGAVSTFGYSGTNRRLVKSVTHTFSGSTTLSATYSYDAVGNRTAMSDWMGSVSYTRDELSQLTSETRAISGVGSFTLTYSYNLAGQLASLTDPYSAQVGYVHDDANRLREVTNSNFGSLTKYARNVKYRAWGGLKSVDYENTRSLALTYDANLRPATYEVPGTLKKSYQYFDDGRLKFTQDQLVTNSKFDRSYDYDQLGRITAAASGADARGAGPTDDRPYNEIMGYDAFDHINFKETQQWTRYDSTGTETYVNNRHQNWLYDSDGRLTSGNGLYTYDAMGQIASFTDGGDLATDQSFDGDGRKLKTLLRSFDSSTNTWTTQKETYYITSTVLNGAVVSEVSAAGQKEQSFVHAAGQVLAVQSVGGGLQFINFKHYDSSGGSYRATNSSGGVSETAEMNPFGADAGAFNISWPPPSGSNKVWPFYGVPELNSVTNGCEWYGVPISCNVALKISKMKIKGMTPDVLSFGDTLVARYGRTKQVWLPLEEWGGSDLDSREVTVGESGGFWIWVDDGSDVAGSDTTETQDTGYPPPRPWIHDKDDCHYLAQTVDEYAAKAKTTIGFVNALGHRFITTSNGDSLQMREFRSSGFKLDFNDDQGSYNQVRHFVGGLSNAYYGALVMWLAPSTIPDNQLIEYGTEEALKEANSREGPAEYSDRALNGVSVPLGVQLGFGKLTPGQLGDLIRKQVCGD